MLQPQFSAAEYPTSLAAMTGGLNSSEAPLAIPVLTCFMICSQDDSAGLLGPSYSPPHSKKSKCMGALYTPPINNNVETAIPPLRAFRACGQVGFGEYNEATTLESLPLTSCGPCTVLSSTGQMRPKRFNTGLK